MFRIYSGLGVGVLELGVCFGFLGLGFSVDGVWGPWYEVFLAFWGWGFI